MQITPLPQGFGAEVTDFDMVAGRTPDDIAHLREAYKRHHLLIFRSAGAIPPERQMEVVGWFGRLITEGKGWTVLDNAEAVGRDVLPFHSDVTFLAQPILGLSLHPEALPDMPTSTSFVSTANAWRALPGALQDELAECTAAHSYTSTEEIDLGQAYFEHIHPVRMPHPETGEPLLFVSENQVARIAELDEQRSAELLTQLFATLYAPERRYEHIWQPGDLIVWHNFAVQHARTRIAPRSAGRRVMRRVLLGEVSVATQMQALRERTTVSAH